MSPASAPRRTDSRASIWPAMRRSPPVVSISTRAGSTLIWPWRSRAGPMAPSSTRSPLPETVISPPGPVVRVEPEARTGLPSASSSGLPSASVSKVRGDISTLMPEGSAPPLTASRSPPSR